MTGLISGLLDFIAWENFTRAGVYGHWALVLLCLFGFLLLSQLLSYALLSSDRYFQSPLEAFVIRAGIGISLQAFVLVFLGLSHLLYVAVFFPLLAISVLLVALFRRQALLLLLNTWQNVLKTYWWLWLLFVLVSLPVLLPPRWFDSTSYHLVYPLKWLKAHYIYADGSMKFPLYTFNFHVLHCIGLFFDYPAFSHGLSWLCGILGTLGILSLLKRLNIWRPLVYLAALAFFLTPVVQQYLTIAYHDVPLMTFFLLVVYGVILLRQEQADRCLQIAMALLAAMLVGMKPTNVLLAPLFLLAVWYLRPLKKILPYALILCCLGSVWYVRNIIIDNDPIPPTVNILRGKEDKFWSEADYRWQMDDIKIKHDWGREIVYKFPLEMVYPREWVLRYWPFLGYSLLAFLSFIYVFFVRRHEQKLYITAFTIVGILIWLGLSSFTRYAHYTALAAVFAAILLHDVKVFLSEHISLSAYRKYLLVAVFAFLLMGPTHNALSYIKNNFNHPVPLTRQERNSFVGWGDPAMLNLIDRMPEYGVEPGDRVYTVGMTQFKYYFEQADILILGDGVNHYRILDFVAAIKQGCGHEFLQQSESDFLLVDKEFINVILMGDFDRAHGFECLYKGERYVLFRVL